MQELLIRKLREHIQDNHPDLMLLLLEESRLEDYLQESVGSVRGLRFEEAFEELTKPLRPSKYNYLQTLLEEEFPNDLGRLQDKGILTTELINMITACDPVFDELKFSEENEDDRYLRYAIMGAIHEYFNSEWSVMNGE